MSTIKVITMGYVSWKFKLFLIVSSLSLLISCQTQEPRVDTRQAINQKREIVVDASKMIGKIRSFQGVNGGPAPLLERLADVRGQYRDIRIDIVRVHDFFGPGDVDAKWSNPDRIARMVNASGDRTIFPNWDSDPEKEESYNFGPTDRIINSIVESGAEVYWRIGRSWAADPEPPKDLDKFAAIVKHVAMHYNHGWANGYHAKIRYWEFWNEPDLEAAWIPGFARPFWTGTPRQFYTLYEKVARILKDIDPTLKVGACGKAAPNLTGPYREGLIHYCASRNVPLDFFSWHHYHDRSCDPYDMVRLAVQYRKLLDSVGLNTTEIHVSEWNMNLTMANEGPHRQASMENAAFTGSALIYLQDSHVSRAFYYRGDATVMGLFGFGGQYRKKAYTYKATGMMLNTPERLSVDGSDAFGFAVLAGKSADGNTIQVLLCNYEVPTAFLGKTSLQNPAFISRRNITYSNNLGYVLTVNNLPWGKSEFNMERYRVSESDNFTLMEESMARGKTFQLEKSLLPPALELIILRRK